MNDLVHENPPALAFATSSLVALGSLLIGLLIALNHRRAERCINLITPRLHSPINGTASVSSSCRGLLMKPQGTSENVRFYTNLTYTGDRTVGIGICLGRWALDNRHSSTAPA